jgi:PEP-CTERM motif
MNRAILTSAAMLLALTASSAASAAQLVVNGDFEADSEIPIGWVITGPLGAHDINVNEGQDYSAAGSPDALQNNFADFGAGDDENVSTLSQLLPTAAGESYAFSFDWGAWGGSQTLTARVINVGSGVVLFSYSETRPGVADLATVFTPASAAPFNFLAGGSTRIEFTAQGSPTTSRDLFLDNVSVLGVTVAIPEPATWTMMMLGFGLAGVSLRRARSERRLAAIA